ncbi:AAA-ATPase ASD, mitochondrial [Linum perenne]
MAGKLSSYLPTLFFLCKLFHKNLPRDYRNHIHEFLHKFLHKFFHKFLYPSVEVTFHEYTNGYHHRRNTIYAAIENYLSSKSIQQAMSLKANSYKGKNQKLLLSMDDHQEVTDDFRGVSLVWSKESSTSKSYLSVKKRFYKLTFNRKHRDLVTGDYIKHVTEEGNAIELHNRQRKLYANGNGNRMMSRVGSETAYWSHIPFNHPASFHTLAIDPVRKKEIMDDLVAFTKSEEYYARIGKAWKRGYLLYGPPGTGKTTMIAAIANFLNYDIYDLELTAVKNNTDLRKLLIEVSSKAIVVIEDIDCSLGITGQRKKSKTTNSKKKKKESIDDDNDTEQECEDESRSSSSKVTLSGLLNIIDGIWSASGGERILVFTTNHVEKLDEALIRRGRMDKHIELSYCRFQGFKVLANNYLSIDSHPLFEVIQTLLENTNISPADVAESLMQKSIDEDPETCLNRLIQDLETTAKEGGRMK